MNVLVGEKKETSVKATATLVSITSTGGVHLYKYSVRFEGRDCTFEYYSDRRGRREAAFSSFKCGDKTILVWEDLKA